MKKTIAKVILATLALSAIWQTGLRADAKSLVKETELLTKTKEDIQEYYVTKTGEIRGITNAESGVPNVFKWTGKKWKEVNDPYTSFTWNVSHKKFTGYTAPVAVNNNYLVANKTTVYRYNGKGKIVNKADLKKKLKLNDDKFICQCIPVRANLVAIETKQIAAAHRVYLYNWKNKKVTALSKKYTDLLGATNKHLYLISGKVGSNERINKVNVVNKKAVASIKVKGLRDLEKDNTVKDDDYGKLNETRLATCMYANQLYLKYCKNIYRWDEKQNKISMVLEGKANSAASKIFGGTLTMISKKKAYIMGNTQDNDGPTNFVEYKG